jgi:hypothetical protein
MFGICFQHAFLIVGKYPVCVHSLWLKHILYVNSWKIFSACSVDGGNEFSLCSVDGWQMFPVFSVDGWNKFSEVGI